MPEASQPWTSPFGTNRPETDGSQLPFPSVPGTSGIEGSRADARANVVDARREMLPWIRTPRAWSVRASASPI